MKKQEHSLAFRVLFNLAVVVTVMALPLIAVTTRASIAKTPVDHSQQQEKSTEELKLEYAQLNVQLAQTELKLAEQFNLELDANIPATVAEEQRRQMLSRKQISKAVMEAPQVERCNRSRTTRPGNDPFDGQPGKNTNALR